MADLYTFTDDIRDRRLIERLAAAYPDARQLITILSRSYEYIQKLPLKGLTENYSRDYPDLFEMAV